MIRYSYVRLHREAHKHGVSPDDVQHALRGCLTIVDLGDSSGRTTSLFIGPDRAGNLLELIGLDLDEHAVLIVHAMRLRPANFRHLPNPAN